MEFSLSVSCRADVNIVRSNVEVLVSEGLGPRGQEDLLLARDTCLALLKIVKAGKVSSRSVRGQHQWTDRLNLYKFCGRNSQKPGVSQDLVLLPVAFVFHRQPS